MFHRYVTDYNRHDLRSSISPHAFLWKRTRTIKDNQERANQYTDIFGWHKNPMNKKRKDIHERTVKWMHLMYNIAQALLQTCIILPPADRIAVPKNFMTFNPYQTRKVKLNGT